LLKALNDFNGAVVLVSHDRRLLEATADRLLLVANGKVTPFEGDLDDYRKFLLTPDAQMPVSTTVVMEAPKLTKEELRRDAAERRRRYKPLKDKVDAAEHQIADFTKEIAKLDASLADPLLFTKDPKKGQAVSKKRADAAKKLEAAEERWLALNEEYEKAMTAEA
jgi:ATP-binding cassette subfamily F protein 3